MTFKVEVMSVELGAVLSGKVIAAENLKVQASGSPFYKSMVYCV